MNHPKSNRAAVIGAGFGGLALAIRLQAGGIRPRCWKSATSRAAAPMSMKTRASPSTPAPPSSPIPPASKELFTLAGKRIGTMSRCCRWTPFYRLCWEDGSHFDYANDQAALDRQIHARNPADVEGYRASTPIRRRCSRKAM
jgi:phytoene desaturase